jgi:hypothetical protein
VQAWFAYGSADALAQRSVTNTGVVVPVPFPPPELLPQHFTVPSASKAQLRWLPAEIAVAPVSPHTGTGVDEDADVRLPSSPDELLPQHWAAPPATSAHAWLSPASIAVAPVKPWTCTGTEYWVVFPLPSCPAELSPQHHTAPEDRRAHVNDLPNDPPNVTATAPVRFVTATGVADQTVVLFPSWPYELSPQQ